MVFHYGTVARCHASLWCFFDGSGLHGIPARHSFAAPATPIIPIIPIIPIQFAAPCDLRAQAVIKQFSVVITYCGGTRMAVKKRETSEKSKKNGERDGTRTRNIHRDRVVH